MIRRLGPPLALGLLAVLSAAGGDLARPAVADELLKLLPRVNRAVVIYDDQQKERAEVFDPKWLEALAQNLNLAGVRREALCLCAQTPEIELYHDDQLLVTLSVHHKDRLRVSATAAAGDFRIGEILAGKVVALAMDKRKLVVRPLPKVQPLPSPKFDVKW